MDQPPRTLPPKKEVLTSLLELSSVRVFLDPRREGVAVPQSLAGQAELVLRLGLDLRPPIPDLSIGDDGVTCTLSFARTPFRCTLPWAAVYAIISDDPTEGRGIVWPDDVPVESQLVTPTRSKPRLAALRDASESPDARSSGSRSPEARSSETGRPTRELRPTRVHRDGSPVDARPQPAPARRPLPALARLERSDGERSDAAGKGEAAAEKKPKRPLPPYLRVVK